VKTGDKLSETHWSMNNQQTSSRVKLYGSFFLPIGNQYFFVFLDVTFNYFDLT
jgi:hypothetical protein